MEHDILIESYIEGLYLKEDIQYLDEGLKDVVSKLTPKVIKNMMPKTFKIAASKDLPGFLKLLQSYGIKSKNVKANAKDMVELTKTLPGDIQEGAIFANKVISNSIPKASQKTKLAASYYIAILAKIKNPKKTNLTGPVRSELKSFIPKVRSFYEEAEERAQETKQKASSEDIADLAVAVATVVSLAALSGIVIWGVFQLMSILITLVWWLALPTALIGMAGLALWLGMKALEPIR